MSDFKKIENKAIILLSGGLDSAVSLGISKEKYDIKLALTFDYGQISAQNEIKAAKDFCKYYNIPLKIITLEFLKDLTPNSLITGKVPDGIQQNSASVWVPNRNGLFLNIAGCFADKNNYDYIIIGANKEEAQNFSDNTQDFINKINEEFLYSTSNHPKVVAPLINFNKNDIVKKALEYSIPLEYTKSCYKGKEKHCGMCESCTRLKNALIANNDTKYLKVLFE